MRRREFVAGFGSAVAWAVVARAQQRALPVIGYLGAQSADDEYKNITVPFLQGLKETGYIEGQNIAIEYHWAENRYDRLPVLTADFVRRRAPHRGGDAGNAPRGRRRVDPIAVRNTRRKPACERFPWRRLQAPFPSSCQRSRLP